MVKFALGIGCFLQACYARKRTIVAFLHNGVGKHAVVDVTVFHEHSYFLFLPLLIR